MTIWLRIKRPLLYTGIILALTAVIAPLAYLAWSPGEHLRNGRHDLRTNGIWLQHGWIGDDLWFTRNRKDKALFRDPARIQALANLLTRNGIKYVFPHLCPCNPDGRIPAVDPVQTESFLDHFKGFKVLPWVGGIAGDHCSLDSPRWRENFVASILALLAAHPRLAGVHVNIEPIPSGNKDFLVLLSELHQRLPAGKILSVAAFPPKTWMHPYRDVHWDQTYFRQVARRVDQIVPMLYDTGIKWSKFYQYLISVWTPDILDWSGNTQVLLGVPAFDDYSAGYHFPGAENLQNALFGIHAGLSRYPRLPGNYAGIAVYSEWEMSRREWRLLRTEFEKTS